MDADITNEVMTQKKDCRLANFELLRIVAMLLNWVASSCLAAYLLHCNFFFLANTPLQLKSVYKITSLVGFWLFYL